MAQVEIPLNISTLAKGSRDVAVIDDTQKCRQTVLTLISEGRHIDALERSTEALRTLKNFSDFENVEFRAMFVAIMFDVAEIHFALKDYKQAERDIEVIFKVLEKLIKIDSERFGQYHILAMELSTGNLRSKKKTIELLTKQQLTTSALFEKVNSGVVEAIDKLVDSLRKVAQLLAATGEYRASLKFYAEAIKYSKRRTGKVNLKEVKMTIEMAEIMMRIRSMRPRAARLLNAVLPHTITLQAADYEDDILALLEIINYDIEKEPRWKAFLHKISLPLRKK